MTRPTPAAPGQAQPAAPAAVAAGAPPTDAVSPHRSLRTPVLIAGVSTALAAALVGSFFIVQGNQAAAEVAAAWDEINAAKDPQVPSSSACYGANRPPACDALATNVSDQHMFQNLAIGAFVTSGVLAAATVTALVLWKEPKAEGGPGASPAKLSFMPLIGAVSGIELDARF